MLSQLNKVQETLSCKTSLWLLGVTGSALWLVFPKPPIANSPEPSRGSPQLGVQHEIFSLLLSILFFFFFLNPTLKLLIFPLGGISKDSFNQGLCCSFCSSTSPRDCWQLQHNPSSPTQLQGGEMGSPGWPCVLGTLACWLSGIYGGIVSSRGLYPATVSHVEVPLPHCGLLRACGGNACLHCLTSDPSKQDKTQTKISPCSYIIKKSFSP